MNENVDKIFNISNYIYGSIKGGYTSIKTIITSQIGFRITITQEEFNYLNRKVIYLSNLAKQIENTMGYIDHISKVNVNEYIYFINSNVNLFDTYLEDFNFVFEEINNDILSLKNKGFTTHLSIPEKENSKEGTEWIYTLFDFYIKYNGQRFVSASDFFYHIRKIWSTIEDKETIIISHITDNILGGISILNISHNLREWITKNGDVIKREYRYIIDTTLNIEKKNINSKFEIFEFIPEYTTCNNMSEEIIIDHFKLTE